MAESKRTARKSDKSEKPGNLVTKDMPITDIVMKYPETFEVFMKYGMHCIGCAAAHFENLEQGCLAHGIDADKMVKDLNAAAEKAVKQRKQDE
ncbi:DUF1858 domain-containing protein [Candidatus Woesearchaeota archaeon]|nr:DUF1858 domain-containing protein [Candidatus Woesearchaeota archaeon]